MNFNDMTAEERTEVMRLYTEAHRAKGHCLHDDAHFTDDDLLVCPDCGLTEEPISFEEMREKLLGP